MLILISMLEDMVENTIPAGDAVLIGVLPQRDEVYIGVLYGEQVCKVTLMSKKQFLTLWTAYWGTGA